MEVPEDRHTREADLPRNRRVAPWVILAMSVGLSAVILAVAHAFKLVAIAPVTSLTDRVADAVAHVTRAEVSITSNTVTVDQADIAELAVVSRKIQTIVKYESDFLGSNNVLILRGDFTVKAGFDLARPFSVSVDESSGTLTTEFPPPKIISVEMDDYEVFHAKQGLWNKLDPEDQELVTRQLIIQARVDAEKSDIKSEAERLLRTRLEDILSDPGKGPVLAAPLP